MSKNVWVASIDTNEDVLSTKIYFETKDQADRYINLVRNNPELLWPGVKMDDCVTNSIIYSVSPIPIQDDSFIDDYEKIKKQEMN